MAQDTATVHLAIRYLRSNSGFAAAARAHLSHIHSAEQLEQWLSEYATPDDRRRLATAIRQSRHRQRHQIKRVPVSPEVHARLSARARQANLPLSRFIDQLTQETNP